jgi:hypothetical protein
LSVKTVRFTQVVERCGAPEAHLVLTDPTKDRALQSAMKAQRMMTVFQESVGTKADRDEMGFHRDRTGASATKLLAKRNGPIHSEAGLCA